MELCTRGAHGVQLNFSFRLSSWFIARLNLQESPTEMPCCVWLKWLQKIPCGTYVLFSPRFEISDALWQTPELCEGVEGVCDKGVEGSVLSPLNFLLSSSFISDSVSYADAPNDSQLLSGSSAYLSQIVRRACSSSESTNQFSS